MKSKLFENEIIIVLFSILFSIFVLLISLPQSINHDLSSYLAPAVALLEGYGQPYKDYFDIKPPLSIFFLYAWIFFFGYSLYSLAVLNFIILSIFFYCFYKIILTISKKNYSYYVFFFTIIISITSAHFEMFLSTEIIGNFFIFLSLYIFFNFKDTKIKWFIIGLSCFIAGQTKEVYFFCIFAFIFLSIYKQVNYKKLLIYLITGWSAGLLLISLLLYQNNILGDYVEIIYFKKEIFNVKIISYGYQIVKTFWSFALHLNIFFLFFCYIVIKIFLLDKTILFKNLINIFFKEKKFISLFLLLLSMLIGFTWQFKPPFDHYFLSLWFFFILVFYFSAVKLAPYLKINFLFLYSNIFLCLVLVVSVIVNIFILDKSEFYKISKNIDLMFKNFKHEFYQKERFEKINVYLDSEACVQGIYGWNSGSLHIYSGKPPCSKFFLSNLITNKKFEKIYRSEILTNPPNLVVYNFVDKDTINREYFENNVFPWEKIISKCYNRIQTSNTYLSKFKKKEMKQCFYHLLKDKIYS